jgi:NAD(P)-dependent dehydrogenase (short-subunit alcohol dehydrogenase family)
VTLQADLDNATEARELVRRAHAELGGLDILINNSAIYERVAVKDIDEAAWDRHLDANLKGPFFVAQEAGKLMQDIGNGLIVNMTDWGVRRPHPEFLPYYASKAGLAAMTAGLARAFAPSVRVNAIAPGPILMPQDSDPAYAEKIRKLTLLNRMGGVQSIVLTVLFLIGNEYVTGETITVDGGRSLQ